GLASRPADEAIVAARQSHERGRVALFHWLTWGAPSEYRRRCNRAQENPVSRARIGSARPVAVQRRVADRRLLAKVPADLWPERLRRSIPGLQQGAEPHHGRPRAGRPGLAGQDGPKAVRPQPGREADCESPPEAGRARSRYAAAQAVPRSGEVP